MRASNEHVRYFEFREGTSSKFWEMTWAGDQYTVRYGKVGTPGRTSSKVFPTAEAAKEAANKLMQQKHAKGYEYVPAKEPAATAVSLPKALHSLEKYDEWYRLIYLPALVKRYGDEDDLEEQWKTAFDLSPASEQDISRLVGHFGPLPEAYRQLLTEAGYGAVNVPDPGQTHVGKSGDIKFEPGELPEPSGFYIHSPERALHYHASLMARFSNEAEGVTRAKKEGLIRESLVPEQLIPIAGGDQGNYMLLSTTQQSYGEIYCYYHDYPLVELLEQPASPSLTAWLEEVLTRAARCEPTKVP